MLRYQLRFSLLAMALMAANVRSLPNNGLGLPGAVRFGSKMQRTSTSTSRSTRGGPTAKSKDFAWIRSKNVSADKPATVTGTNTNTNPKSGAGDAGSKMATFSISQQLFLMPLLVLVASPSVAPLSNTLLEILFTVGSNYLAVLLQFIRQIGIVYKHASQELSKISKKTIALLQISSSYVSDHTVKAVKYLLRELEIIGNGVGQQLEKICKTFAAMCIAIGGSTCQVATSTFLFLCTAASIAKNGISTGARKTSSFVSSAAVGTAKELKLVTDLTLSAVAQGTVATCGLLASTCRNVGKVGVNTCQFTCLSVCTAASIAKNGISTGARKTSSFVSSAAVGTAKELKLVTDLTLSAVAQGTVATCGLLASTCRNVGQEIVSAWKITSSFVTFVCESGWRNAVAASVITGRFVKTQSEFLATEFVNAVEMIFWGIVAVPKGVFNGMVWFKNKVPIWFNKFVDAMPFMERVDDEIVPPKTWSFFGAKKSEGDQDGAEKKKGWMK